MNRALVRRATAGVAAWLHAQGRQGPVVVGRDARHRSADFADDTASVLAGAGFPVLVLPRPLPTPVAAFATRHLGAVAGIVITASHNPPQDNGYKLYLGDGAQIVPPVDEEISAHIDAVASVADLPMSGVGVEVLGEQVVDAYLDGAVALLDDGPRQVQVVYTAMHGVGADTLRAAFARAGFPPALEVREQAEPDPDFPTVAFPNPEEPGALDLALALARSSGADLVLANDPDADRLGIAFPTGRAGEPSPATTSACCWPTTCFAPVATVPTTCSPPPWCRRASCRRGPRGGGGLRRGPDRLQVGGPHGRPGPALRVRLRGGARLLRGRPRRDKDGITAALVAAALAAQLRANGSSLRERLDDLARAHGAHVTRQRSIRVSGGDWMARVTDTMAAVRADPPTALAGRAVLDVEDLAEARRFPVPPMSSCGPSTVPAPSSGPAAPSPS